MRQLRSKVSVIFLMMTLLAASGCGSDNNNSSGSVASTSTSLSAKMDGAQMVPAVATNATGTGSFVLNAAKTAMTFEITIEGLSSAITSAHLHNAAAGANGGVARTLTADFIGNTASGTWTSTDGEPLTAAMVTELEAGRIYVNIHNAANQPGEIRGQILVNAAGSTGFTAKVDGIQMVPAVTTASTGTGAFSLNAAKTAMTFQITVEGLSGAITAAHLHNAAAGANGGVARTLTADFTGNTASGTWTSTDGEPLTAAMVTELEAGRIYVNIHTAANQPGEIRGQVLANP